MAKVQGHQPQPNPNWYWALRLKVLGVAGAHTSPSLIGGDFKPRLEKGAQRHSFGLASKPYMALLYSCLISQMQDQALRTLIHLAMG